MIDVTIEQAYAEACRALGESIVRERLLQQHIASTASGEVRSEG